MFHLCYPVYKYSWLSTVVVQRCGYGNFPQPTEGLELGCQTVIESAPGTQSESLGPSDCCVSYSKREPRGSL